MAANGTIRVTPVLFCAPVFWTAGFWSESAHAWDWVRAETPLDEKPWAELEISLDVTLGAVFGAACDAWGIVEGPDAAKYGDARANQFARFAFVRPDADAAGVEEYEGPSWPFALPIARENGIVSPVPGLEITYRELLASSKLGLLEGDVTRPYVRPVVPQGDAGRLVEAARLTVEAIQAAYGAVDDAVGYADHTLRLIRASLPEAHRMADRVVDEGIRVGAVVGFFEWLRRQRRRRRSRHNGPKPKDGRH